MARVAAVSRQTVSNVLNGSGRVGDDTRTRVLAAVEELGYHPHHGARSLRSRRTRQVAYVMAPWAISSRIILATCSYGGTAESGSITSASIPGEDSVGKIRPGIPRVS